MTTILLVDDDEDIRELTAEILRESGYDVVEAEDGQQALSALAEMATPPALVLLDLIMPIMTGQQMLQEMRAIPELAQVPVVALTAGGFRPADVPDAQDVVRKPASVAVLLKVVEQFCKRPEA
jgi:CRP/FNR family transcriptional regulator, cyclic AMP receptor protein